MISVNEAIEQIKLNIPRKKVEYATLRDALGYVLAQDVRSSIPLPVFDNSAMDGFVLRAADISRASRYTKVRLKIAGNIRAGETKNIILKAGETYRIMTGAPIPLGADTILIKEEAKVVGDKLVMEIPIKRGKHIRRQGEEIKKGERVLKKGVVIHPGTIGFLATLGIDKVKVFSKPKVSVITTGSELTPPGRKLKHGKIYESNSWMIQAALQEMEICSFTVETVKDDLKSLRKVLQRALKKSEVVILTGGVSVGDFDYVKMALEECKVKRIFWRVKQKPGKPLYFGKLKQTLIFGLPGNPASVFTCFYKYVYPAIRLASGFHNAELEREKVSAANEIQADAKRTLLFKSRVQTVAGKKQVSTLRRQGSHMLSSLCESNAFVVLPASSQSVRKGSKVHVDLLPVKGS